MAIWQPQAGPQSLAIAAQFVRELLFGGARGGGKSDYLLGDYLQDVGMGSKWTGIIFRRSYAELEELVKRAKELYLPLGAEHKVAANTFVFPSGATLKMRYLEKEKDADKYQGHQYAWVGWDELTNWASQNAYNKLKACNRSAEGVPFKRIRASANPGGSGHHWVKEYFVDPCPSGGMLIDGKRMFIRSLLTDNKILTTNDPTYVETLKELGSPELIKAWLEGDWNVITGAFFPEFSMLRHVIRPFKIPAHWLRFRSGDWGTRTPFSYGWWAVSEGYQVEGGPWIPQGAIVRYREWYGSKGARNVGLGLSPLQVARGIKERELQEKITYGVLDPSAWRSDTGPSAAEHLAREKVFFRKADNQREMGWVQVRSRLIGNEEGDPMIFFFDTCIHTIRTFPAIAHDINNPEDADTEGEDHAADDIRYACMSRPYVKMKPKEKEPLKLIQNMTYDDLWAAQDPVDVYMQI